MSLPRRRARTVLAACAVAISLLLVEAGLRWIGYTPFQVVGETRLVSNTPWSAFDSELGWTNAPGRRVSWEMGDGTFWHDASRATRPNERTTAKDVVMLIGCSYTQGFLVADADTFAWKLQQRFPEFDVRNFGTGGYGTYQSLLRFRRYLRDGHPVPRLVIFGFGEFHGVRDRATASWMKGLRFGGSIRAFLPPRVDLVDGRLVERKGRFIEASRLARASALWNLIEERYVGTLVFAPDDNATEAVHRATLRALRAEVERAGSKFLLADLWTMRTNRESWRAFFESDRFPIAECVTPGLPYKHPDAFWHLRHADCIEQEIDRRRLLQ